MKTSFLNIFFFLLSLSVLILGILMVTNITSLELIPDEYNFLNIQSLAIVFGGIAASVFISYPFRSVLTALRQSTLLFSHSNVTQDVLEQDVARILEWQKLMRIRGRDAISQLSTELEGSFEGYLFTVLDTNYSLEELRELGEINIHENYNRQRQINSIMSSMGRVSPVFGMLGTLFGLIVILSGFNEVESLLSGLGSALMTTLYGIIIGNFVFTPMSKKMDMINSRQYFREQLLLEGLLLILQQKTSLQIYDKLQAHLQRSSFER